MIKAHDEGAAVLKVLLEAVKDGRLTVDQAVPLVRKAVEEWPDGRVKANTPFPMTETLTAKPNVAVPWSGYHPNASVTIPWGHIPGYKLST